MDVYPHQALLSGSFPLSFQQVALLSNMEQSVSNYHVLQQRRAVHPAFPLEALQSPRDCVKSETLIHEQPES